MGKKAEARVVKISSADTDDTIFHQAVSAFQLPYSSIHAFTCNIDIRDVLIALISAIRFKCRESEQRQNTIDSRDRQLSDNQKTFKELQREIDELRLRYAEDHNTDAEIVKKCQKYREALDQTLQENKELTDKFNKLAENYIKLQQLHFGVKSEKTDGLEGGNSTDNNDPLDENADADGNNGSSGNRGTRSSKKKTKNSKKRKNKKKDDLSGLALQRIYQFDPDEYDRLYGKGNWKIIRWHESGIRVECIPAITYGKQILTPVIKTGSTVVKIPCRDSFVQHSFIGRTLLAEMMCEKFMYYVPAYRIENNPTRYGFSISRQTITNMFNNSALKFFMPVYNRMQKRLAGYRWQQCDETTWLVIRDNRSKGTKSYFWVHRSSELDKSEPPIILYQIELSRSEDHLEKFFQDQITNGDIRIYLSSDAYSAYKMLARLYPEIFTCCFCLAHCRRRFVDALNILKNTSKSADLSGSAEMKMVTLINKMYDEEARLHDMTAEERLAARKEKISPLMDQFFIALRGLDLNDPAWSATMKDAVSYSLNHETELRQFLNDGSIPIDNNACERSVKNVALSRKNSLFSYSLDGASASGVILTMIRTAIANGASPYYYLLYLLTYMPDMYYNNAIKKDDPLDDMMPWSDKYREFEKAKMKEFTNRSAPPSDKMPEAPYCTRKKKAEEPSSAPQDFKTSACRSIFSKNVFLRTTRSIQSFPMAL